MVSWTPHSERIQRYVCNGERYEKHDSNGASRRQGETPRPFTVSRPKPGVPFGGKYKIIDFVLSNLFNLGIKKVYIMTLYRAYSLNKHIRDSWSKWTGLEDL